MYSLMRVLVFICILKRYLQSLVPRSASFCSADSGVYYTGVLVDGGVQIMQK